MSDIKKVLAEEIRRLAKKEINLAVEPLLAKITALRKQVSKLSKQCVSVVAGKPGRPKTSNPDAQNNSDQKVRLNAAGIRRIREKLNVTQDAFAKILGVSKPALCTWEYGKCSPNSKTKEKIASLRKMSRLQLKKMMDEMGIKQSTPRKLKPRKN